MKALVYKRVGSVTLNDHPRPTIILPTDAIVKVTKTTICGTDLHIRKGDVATCTPGRVLGHEGIGVIDEVGASVNTFKSGDKVIISCISSCASCEYCRKGMNSHCTTGGWLLGNSIDGTQAEYVRIPHANSSLYPIPSGLNESAAVMLSDIFPTALECGVLNGKIQPGGSVAVIGAGPVGLATVITAQLYSPSTIIVIDQDINRLKVAESLGASHVIDPKEGQVDVKIKALTDGKGCDTVIEAVGVPETFEMCQGLVAPGGVIANIGVHGAPVTLHLDKLWSQNISITTRLVDAVTTPMLSNLVIAGRLNPSPLITHKFAFKDIEQAYSTFSEAASQKALKVLLEM